MSYVVDMTKLWVRRWRMASRVFGKKVGVQYTCRGFGPGWISKVSIVIVVLNCKVCTQQ